jgi:hypothetical protein
MHKHIPLIFSCTIFCFALVLLFPYLQYYVDPDGVGYLTVAQRYATADYSNAINGYWSPFSCWGTALLIVLGIKAVPASIAFNTLSGVGILWISNSFFSVFNYSVPKRAAVLITLTIFLCYAVFWQTFADLWLCFFVLCVARLFNDEQYFRRPLLWMLSGILGALAYFSKAYGFPFFLLFTMAAAGVVAKPFSRAYIKIVFISIVTFLVVSLPWLVALHHKYHIWTTSNAGSLNLSWFLVGHPIWKDGIGWLIPPQLKGSPVYWEDAYLVNKYTPHFWDSIDLAKRESIRVGWNVCKFFISMAQISIFLPVIWCCTAYRFILKKYYNLLLMNLLVAIILIFPLGYFLVNFEARYIWVFILPSIVLGFDIVRKVGNSKNRNIVAAAFLFSFLVTPIWGIAHMVNDGREEFDYSEQLKATHISGSFTADAYPAYMDRLAYFSGNSYFYNVFPSLPRQNAVNKAEYQQQLVKEMRQYNVQYYFHIGDARDTAFENLGLQFRYQYKRLFVYEMVK